MPLFSWASKLLNDELKLILYDPQKWKYLCIPTHFFKKTHFPYNVEECQGSANHQTLVTHYLNNDKITCLTLPERFLKLLLILMANTRESNTIHALSLGFLLQYVVSDNIVASFAKLHYPSRARLC